MGLYIPDMKMPIDCGDCPFTTDLARCILPFFLTKHEDHPKTFIDVNGYYDSGNRPDWCPLEEFDKETHEDAATAMAALLSWQTSKDGFRRVKEEQ